VQGVGNFLNALRNLDCLQFTGELSSNEPAEDGNILA